jgi:hypothetical protein
MLDLGFVSAILPNKNLVSNIGFDALALNTKNPNQKADSKPQNAQGCCEIRRSMQFQTNQIYKFN